MTGNPTKILIIEDNVDLSDIFKIAFEMDGYEVHTSFDGREGIEAAKEFQPDVVLLDLMMPEVNGYNVLKTLREGNERNSIIVINSNLAADSDVEKAMNMGADEYIHKADHTPDQVVKMVKRIIEEKLSQASSSESKNNTEENKTFSSQHLTQKEYSPSRQSAVQSEESSQKEYSPLLSGLISQLTLTQKALALFLSNEVLERFVITGVQENTLWLDEKETTPEPGATSEGFAEEQKISLQIGVSSLVFLLRAKIWKRSDGGRMISTLQQENGKIRVILKKEELREQPPAPTLASATDIAPPVPQENLVSEAENSAPRLDDADSLKQQETPHNTFVGGISHISSPSNPSRSQTSSQEESTEKPQQKEQKSGGLFDGFLENK